MSSVDQKRWREMASTLLAEADRLVHPEDRARKLVEVGDLYRDQSNDLARASEYYFQAVAVNAQSPQSPLSRLVRLARDSGDVHVTANLVAALSHAGHWRDVVTVLVRQAEATSDPQEKTGLTIEAARICEQRLNDSAQARQLLLQAAQDTAQAEAGDVVARLRPVFDQDPTDGTVAITLARLYVEGGAPKEAVAVLTRAAAATRDLRRKSGLLFDAAILCADRTNEPVDAVIRFYEAQVLDPERGPNVIARLEAIEAHWVHLPKVADALERAYTKLKQPERLQRVMGERLESTVVGERGPILLRQAEHAEYQLLDSQRAFELYRRGVEQQHDPLDRFAAGLRRVGAEAGPDSAVIAADLFEQHQMWHPLAALMDDEAAFAVEDEDRAELFFRAGDLLEKRAGDLDGAMERYLRAFKLSPKNVTYIRAGERLYRQRGDWAMVERLLNIQLHIVPEAFQGELWAQLGQLKLEHLNAPTEAYDAARNAITAGEQALGEALLNAVVLDAGAFATVEHDLRHRADEEGQTGALALLTEIARLHLEVRNDPEGALGPLREAAGLIPTDAARFKRVSEIYTQIGDDWRLAEWLASAGKRPLPTEIRLQALRRAGTLYQEHGAAFGDARDAWLAALEIAPHDEMLFEGVLSAAQAAREPGALVAVLEDALKGRIGPEDVELETRLSWLRMQVGAQLEVGNRAGAADAFEAVFAELPLDSDAARFLHDWYTEHEAWTALQALLDAQAVAWAKKDGTPHIPTISELAELAEHQLKDPGQAAVYLQTLIELPSERKWVQTELHRLYQAQGDRDGRLGLLELQIGDVDLVADRVALAERLIALAEEPPVNQDVRIRGLQVLVISEPSVVASHDRLIEALREGKGSAGLERALADRWALDRSLDNLPLLTERATLLREPLERAEEAVPLWLEALTFKPDDDTLIASLQRAHEACGDFVAVHDLLRRRSASAEGEAGISLLREAAVCAELQLGDLARAISDWKMILRSSPNAVEPRLELIRLYEASEKWGALIDLGEPLLPELDPPDRGELARQMARLCQVPLDRPEQGERLWNIVRGLHPLDVEALQALVVCAERRHDLAGVADFLGRQAEATDDREERALVLERQAELLAELDRVADASAVWRQIHTLRPTDRAPIEHLMTLAERCEDPEMLAEAIELELELVDDVEERQALQRRLARIIDESLDDDARAATAWEAVLKTSPNDEGVLLALRSIYATLKRRDDLIRVLRVLLESTETDELRIERLTVAGRLLETAEADPNEVYECWWRAFKLEPDDKKLVTLRRLAKEGALWSRLNKALKLAQHRTAERSDQIGFLMEQATITETHLNDPEAALAHAFDAFELDPQDERPLPVIERLGQAKGAWEDVIGAWRRAADSAEPTQRAILLARAAAATETHLADPTGAFELYSAAWTTRGDQETHQQMMRLVESGGLWGELIEIYTARREGQSLRSSKLETLHEIARLLEEQAGDWERAFEQYVLALQISPQDERTRTEVWRLAEAHGVWEIVARVLALKVEEAEDGWPKLSLLHDLGEIQAGPLDEPAEAFKTIRKAFAIKPWDEITHARLRELAGRLDDWKALAAFFEEEAGWAEDRHARVSLYRQAAEILTENKLPGEAARVLQRVAELTPNDAEVVERLLGLHRASKVGGAAEAFAEALERHSREGEPEVRASRLAELAALYRGPLHNLEKAEGAYERLLKIRPDDEQAAEGLFETLESRRAWAALATALERQIRHTQGEARHAMLRRQAWILETQLKRAPEAFQLLIQVARDLPEDLDLLFDLARRARAAGGEEELLICAEQSVEVADPEHLPDVLLLIGRTARDRFRNEKKALSALSRAFELRPDDRSLAREIAAMLKRKKRHRALIDLFQQAGPGILLSHDAVPRPEDEARWALEIAALQTERLFKFDEAIATVEGLLEQQPGNVAALERLGVLARRAKNPARMESAALELAAASPESRRVSVLERAARDLQAEREAGRAVRIWRELLVLKPTHGEALAAVGRFAEKEHDWDLLAEQTEARARGVKKPIRRAALLCELGAIHREQRDDIEAAKGAYERALGEVPDQIHALRGLIEIAQNQDDIAANDRYGERLIQRIESERDPKIRRQITADVATFLLAHAERARADGDDAQATVDIERAYRCAAEGAGVAQAYATLLYDRDDRVEAAQIYAELPPPSVRLPSEAQAVEHLRRAHAFRAANHHDRALRHYEAAALKPQTRQTALAALAELHRSADRWEAAARVEEKWAETQEENEARARGLAVAGRIVETRLNKPRRAVKLYERAIADGLDDVELLWHVLGTLQEHDRVEAAHTVIDRLVRNSTLDSNQRAELLCIRGQLLEAREEREKAQEAYGAALEHSPLLLAAVDGVLGTLDVLSAEDQVGRIRRINAGCTGAQAQDRAPVLERLGTVLLAREDTPGALEIYEALHAAEPEHVGAQAALADLYARMARGEVKDDGAGGHIQRAIGHRLAHLRARPAEPESLRELVALYRTAGHTQNAISAMRVLALLGEATEAERSWLSEQRQRHGVPSVVLDRNSRCDLIADDEQRQPVALMMRAFHTLIGPSLDEQFRGRQAGEPASVIDPSLAKLVAALTQALEIPNRKLWLTGGGRGALSLVRLDPPELVADVHVISDLPGPERCFLLGRALELTRGPAVFAQYLPAAEARALFAASVVFTMPNQGPEYAKRLGVHSDRLRYWLDFVQSHLTDENRHHLLQFAGPVLAAGPAAFEAWVSAVQRTAQRIGLVMCGDLIRSIGMVLRERPELQNLRIDDVRSFRELLDASPEILDLYTYAFSQRLHDLRLHLKVDAE